MTVTIHQGDALEVLRTFASDSIDAIVTDPPYGIRFMGSRWDYDIPSVEVWAECLRVLKPGGHLLAFAGTRTQHRMASRIEEAGFEIRDLIAWVYGEGMPKSMDVSKAIDKMRDDRDDILRVTTYLADAADRRGVSRADVDAYMGTSDMGGWWLSRLRHRCQCPTVEQWQRLKALLDLGDEMDEEVVRLNGRKGTHGEAWQSADVIGIQEGAPSGWRLGDNGLQVDEVDREIKAPNSDDARRWVGWGTGLKPALEPITLARKPLAGTVVRNVLAHGTGAINIDACRVPGTKPQVTQGINTRRTSFNVTKERRLSGRSDEGRWPANLVHDGSDEVVSAFPDASGQKAPLLKDGAYQGNRVFNPLRRVGRGGDPRDDGGSAARFYYCAKPSESERGTYNTHPTVKPVALMRYLVTLITPPGGVVLDPYAGSGTTGVAAQQLQFSCHLIDSDPASIEIARRRLLDDTPPLFREPAP